MAVTCALLPTVDVGPGDCIELFWVRQDQRGFYARSGYSECDRTPGYPHGHDDIHHDRDRQDPRTRPSRRPPRPSRPDRDPLLCYSRRTGSAGRTRYTARKATAAVPSWPGYPPAMARCALARMAATVSAS